jgi:uncharacterized protein YqfA (UPF0365 family)
MDALYDSPIALVVVTTAIVCAILLFASGAPFVWIRARIAGCPVSLVTIIGMRMRSVPAGRIVDAYILCKREGIIYPIENLEALYLSVPGLFTDQITSMVKARREGK